MPLSSLGCWRYTRHLWGTTAALRKERQRREPQVMSFAVGSSELERSLWCYDQYGPVEYRLVRRALVERRRVLDIED